MARSRVSGAAMTDRFVRRALIEEACAKAQTRTGNCDADKTELLLQSSDRGANKSKKPQIVLQLDVVVFQPAPDAARHRPD
jgi:hypothetical protein